MSESELVYRKRCDHGYAAQHWRPGTAGIYVQDLCSGGFEVVLPNDKVLTVLGCCQDEELSHGEFAVSDVLAVLDKEVER